MTTRLQTRVTRAHHQKGSAGFRLEVDAEFGPGVTAIFGPSGSGKSTWLECVAGVQHPEDGAVVMGDRVLFDSHHNVNVAPSQRGIGYIFQDAALFPHMTVRANVEYGLHERPARERRAKAQHSMETFHIENLAERSASSISGGERQRVALARALVRDPRCVMLDEPFSALDCDTKLKIIDDVMEWNRTRQVPVLLVTHALEEVLAMAARVIVLERGRVIDEGRPDKVLAPQRERLLARLVPGTSAQRDLLS